MAESKTENDHKERGSLLLEVDQLQAELRRRLLALVEHSAVSEEFKSNSVVRNWVK